MPSFCSWLVPNSVLQVSNPVVSNDEFLDRLDAEILQYLDAASKPVHVVIDVRHVVTHPSPRAFLRLRYLKHPQMGHVITVGMTRIPMLRFITSRLARVLNVHLTDLSNMEEVQDHLKTLDIHN
jgi:hypothetical protein